MDANSINEAAQRRAKFSRWLVRAWDWATDNRVAAADVLAELIAHVDELDYPLFELARSKGVTGEGKLADALRGAVGAPVKGPVAEGWEREINYSPIIALEEGVWHSIYNQLNWVNRSHDKRVAGHSFYLWSEAANPVLFVIRKTIPLTEETDDVV